MEDQHIVALLWERSERAIDSLSRTYGSYCMSIAERIVCDREDAEECVNDAYLRVWETVPPERPQSLKAYLGTIVRNLAINRYRRVHTQKRSCDRVSELLDELTQCLPAQYDWDSLTDDMVIRNCLNRFLRELSSRERRVFVRRYWYADSVTDIAKLLHTKENAVYVMLSRTRQKLKEALKREGIVL